MPIHTEKGTIPEQLDYLMDNRDPGETWLWFDEIHYISVKPYEVIENMLENCEHWLYEADEGPQMERSEVDHAMQVLARACGQT